MSRRLESDRRSNYPAASNKFGVQRVAPCMRIFATQRVSAHERRALRVATRAVSSVESIAKEEITGVILAGGRARRMGGEDKGLVSLNGHAMIEYSIRCLSPQVGAMLINANRNIERYAELGNCPVVEDSIDGFAGPLAGVATAMQSADSAFVLTAPCDCPLIAPDLAQRFIESLARNATELCVAHDGDRLQPVFALISTQLLQSLLDYLHAGGRKIDTWYAQHDYCVCDLSDRTDTFLNVNTPQERDALADKLKGQSW